MATWDSLIEVEVVTDSPAVTRQGFTVGLIASGELEGAFTDRLRYYESAGEVAADEDVDAETAAAASAYFAACEGNGRLGIGRLDADQKQITDFALGGSFEDGDTVTLTIGDEEYEVTASNATLSSLAQDLRTALGASSLVDVSGADAHVICTSKNAGEAFAFSIAKTGTLGVVGYEETQGAIDLSTELSAILADSSDWFGFALLTRSKAANEAAATWAAANERLFVGQSSDSDILSGTAGNLLEEIGANNWAVIVVHDDDEEHAAIGTLANRLQADPDDTATVWAWTQIPGVTSAGYTAAQRENIESQGGNCYLDSRAGVVLNPGQCVSGQKVDVTVTKAWMAARSAEGVLAKIVAATARLEKIPYTDAGLAILEGAVREVVARGVAANHLVAGSDTYQSTAAADVPSADKAARLARLTVIVTLAGAVERVAFRVRLV